MNPEFMGRQDSLGKAEVLPRLYFLFSSASVQEILGQQTDGRIDINLYGISDKILSIFVIYIQMEIKKI